MHRGSFTAVDDLQGAIPTFISPDNERCESGAQVAIERQSGAPTRPGSGPKPGKGGEKDPDTRALEADLSERLGLEVDLRHAGETGELRIRYSTLEQLDDLCRRLSQVGK